LLAVVCGAARCIAEQPPTPRAEPCTPSFPYSDGWLGGDGGYSISLGGGRTLWLFADTFVGRDRARTRVGVQMVSNTIGVSECSEDGWHIHYYWQRATSSASARAFFNTDDSSVSYWPLDGFSYRGEVDIVLMRVVKTPEGGPFGFKIVGTNLARVTNPSASPERWSISYSILTDSESVLPGASIVLRPPYAYLFAVLDDSTHHRHGIMLTRIALSRLDRPSDSIQYLARHGKWKHARDPRDVRVLVEDGAPEFSVRYHPEVGKWVLVQQNPRFGSGEIDVRFADRMEGSWSAYRPLAAEPEMNVNAHDRKIFCYAAREHSEFDPEPRVLLLTYACNSLDLDKLAGDLSIYRPAVLRAQLP